MLNLERMYRILEPYRDLFVDALHAISRMKADRSLIGMPTIGIFLRSGDMRCRKPDSPEERVLRTHGYGYIPAGYAAEALARRRRIAGWQVSALLSTDVMPGELAPIISQGGVQLARTDSALVNVLEMSRHAVLVIGTSSYGRWSWFLGDALAIVPRVENPKAWIPPIENRDSAWFVFDDETSLNYVAVSASVSARLARPR